MRLAPETREILRQYKALINARRRENGQSALRTEQVIDEICYYMTCQSAVYLCGQFIRQDGSRSGRLSARAYPPGRLAPAGKGREAALRATPRHFPL